MNNNTEIKSQYEHSKAGTFMFNLCANWTAFIVKHKWLFYLLSLTWGILMTIFGTLITVVFAIAKIFDKKITFFKYYWVYGIKVGPEYWGGMESGLMFIRDHKSSDRYINDHEFGHMICQNCLFGPLAIFMCFLPSATRYWYQEIRSRKGLQNKPYDSIWFEDAATMCGRYAVEKLTS